ncbi:helix-turn-helix domain-containing protein [Polymorphospora rubra]|uniref:helix-turn-helix domain-containing protein n=1 Tax=Polymorphospora rubra TaxID=338584 RepID=UPI0033EF6D5C
MAVNPYLLSTTERGADVTDLSDLARLLRQLRRRQARQRGASELTYRELAARTGWSIGTIAGYFGGRTLPPTNRLDVLAALLEATPAELGVLATARDHVQEGRRPVTSAAGPGRWPVPRQLPGENFHFVGRETELTTLDALLDRAGPPAIAVLLTGTAGAGKTALAVKWAHRNAGRFPHGQLHVNLGGFDPDGPPVAAARVVRDVAAAFGVPGDRIPAGPDAQIGLYRSVLAGRRVLMILDNARDADQVRPLLPGSPGCVTIVTSRNQLTSLVAVDGAHHLVVELPAADEARQLLAHRLGPARARAEPTVVDELVDHCARLPLAMVIAAARADARPNFPIAVLAEELRLAHGSLDLFSGDDAPADLRVAFACSYRQLTPSAATLFRLVGNHPAPDVDVDTAADLAEAAPAHVRPVLAELTRAHLLTEHRPGRYACHDLLRAFAREQTDRTAGGYAP